MSVSKNKLDTGLIRELAAILREGDLGEIEIEHEGQRYRLQATRPRCRPRSALAPSPSRRAPRTMP